MSDIEEYPSADPESTSRGGFTPVLVATAVVGVAGYVITWLVPFVIGTAAYTTFAIYWSFTFLLAAGLSGIQQEVTRATGPADAAAVPPRSRLARALPFALATSLLVFVIVVVSALFWADAVFPEQGWAMVWPLAVGGASYVLLTVLTGTLYGSAHWRGVFWVILMEGTLRLILIAGTLVVTTDQVALAWAVAIPFPTTFVVIWLAAGRRLVQRTQLDVGYRQLVWNVARTVLAATGMGLLVSGFPFLLGVTSPDADPDRLGTIILLATLVRAPLIVVGLALQSYLVVLFRGTAHFWGLLLRLEGVVLAVGAVLVVAGWTLGPAVFALLFPEEPPIDGSLIAVLAASSTALGALCITAPATLSRSRHGLFTAGWVVAALVTIGCLLLPLELEARTTLALIVGPVCGLLVQAVGLPLLERRRA
ncbi:hypothetical protein [Leifsonia sp. Leaf264]|uniref:hypothetical protein n=1 Tax=Leifsonia sp. Leaf264 TaxID=1736314 RepID=UPI0006FB5A89|nr:hypothetical protein [Leifsonia sp. Leaf264]KQO99437.1 hypothetical protein ASF30_05720 [Leifsonia sp. Leaf264]